MPTTTYTTPTISAAVIGARTDAAGGAVSDTTAEEARLNAILLTEGYLAPALSFKVAAQAVPDMTVKVGSGVAKSDHYVVAGEIAGQGNYIVRLDATSQNVTVDAADASQSRTDEIYLVVRDNPYDASSRALPQLGYRKGDLGGANPGVDAAWKASVILARIAVGAAVTTVTNTDITDLRQSAGFAPPRLVTTPINLTDATTITTDASQGNHFRVTLGGNRTLANPSNPTDGQRMLFEITQDGAGGRTLTLGSNFKLGTDISSTTLSTTANARDYIGVIYRASAGKFEVIGLARGY